mgnify:CR=1 FL=1
MKPATSSVGCLIIALAALLPGISCMDERTIVKDLAVEVNDALTAYINVHDDVFELKAARVTPIPGIFEAIDFAKHVQSLVAVENELVQIGVAIRSSRDQGIQATIVADVLVSFDAYRSALLITVQEFKMISERLYEKSQNPGYYRWDTYQQDMDRYERSIDRYSELGDELNTVYQRLRS